MSEVYNGGMDIRERGLTGEAVRQKQRAHGFNEITEKKKGVISMFFRWFLSPIAIMLLIAAFLSLGIGKVFDFWFIIFLMLINFFVGFWQEKKADTAIAKLGQKLLTEVRTLRTGQWEWVASRDLVVDDIIELNLGDVVPADVEVLEARNLSVNEAVLTGESLPKEKKEGENCYSGAFVALGWGRFIVMAIGADTSFGKTLTSIETTRKPSTLEKDILRISKGLALLSIVAVIILTAFLLWQGEAFWEIVTLDLSLVIAGIPISLPTIMTLIISFGVIELSKKETIVRRLSSLEDLANVDLLFSDKTGTLTKNEIGVEEIIPYGAYQKEDVLCFASFTTKEEDKNPINRAMRSEVQKHRLDTEHEILEFIPFDSVRKRSTAIVMYHGEKMTVRTGAPQVILEKCSEQTAGYHELLPDVEKAAREGYRAVAVALKEYGKNETSMKLVGVLFFSDSLEDRTGETIRFLQEQGIDIKMLTGDNKAIAERVAKKIGLKGGVLSRSEMPESFAKLTPEAFMRTGAFAEIFPKDKYDLVEFGQMKMERVVAATGDGVNDLPALKVADVSIAVRNAVDALKGAADIVLTQSGIAVIHEALIESRRIFARLYTYSVYRISESFRIIITIVFLGIAYKTYPLAPIQLILLALLNDIPIVSLAFDRVKVATQPAKIHAVARMKTSLLYGLAGIANSILLVFYARNMLHLDWPTIQTLFFLKLTVSGHMLIYVAHTKERWYKYLPSPIIIWATSLTQLVATGIAVSGVFMHAISWQWALFIWGWSFLWMQVAEGTKILQSRK